MVAPATRVATARTRSTSKFRSWVRVRVLETCGGAVCFASSSFSFSSLRVACGCQCFSFMRKSERFLLRAARMYALYMHTTFWLICFALSAPGALIFLRSQATATAATRSTPRWGRSARATLGTLGSSSSTPRVATGTHRTSLEFSLCSAVQRSAVLCIENCAALRAAWHTLAVCFWLFRA